MMERESRLGQLEIKVSRRGSANSFGSAKLVALAGILVLALVLCSAGLAAGAASASGLERGLEASTMRWVAMGEDYLAARAEAAATTMTARYKALAESYVRKGSMDDTKGGYSGDDAYDPAAAGHPERSVAQVMAKHSRALSGGHSW